MKKGFTLIELIVVLAIIAIISSILVPNFIGYSDKAKIIKARQNAKTVLNSLNAYNAEAETTAHNWMAVEGNNTISEDAKKYINKKIDPTLAKLSEEKLQNVVDGKSASDAKKQLKIDEANRYIDGR